MKFAFLMDVKGVSPKTYSTVYETSGRYNLVAGVDGQEAAEKYIEKLAEAGFEEINLTGDFDAKFAADLEARLREKNGSSVKIKAAYYALDELMKLQFVDSFRDYGLIIMDEGVDRYHEVVLRSAYRDTRIIFVENMRRAKNAAIRLDEKRADVIDLCSSFDIMQHEYLVRHVRRGLPMGTCGEVDLSKL